MTSNSLTRMTGATALGAVITALVLYLMQSLIQSDGAGVEARPLGPTLTFIPVIEEQFPETTRRLPPQPLPPDIPPPLPPRLIEKTTGGADTTGFGPAPEVALPTDIAGAGASEGDALPIVKVRPVYPQSAIRRGVEGSVLVQFSIDTLGRVVDAVVLEAKPQGVFERAALQAVERFRYKPRVLNGQPTPVSGVRHLLTFELDS